MRIGIDVDGVLRDFVTAFKGVVGQEYPNATIPEMISTWKFEDDIIGLSREEIKEIYKEKFSKQCFQDALPFSEVVPTFWMLEKWAEREGHELIIVTSQIPQNRHYTLSWLGKYNLNPNSSAMFDDIAKNLVPAKKVGFTSIWIDAGYENFSDDIESSKKFLDYSTTDLHLFLEKVNKGNI